MCPHWRTWIRSGAAGRFVCKVQMLTSMRGLYSVPQAQVSKQGYGKYRVPKGI